jgi:hypothetical protein
MYYGGSGGRFCGFPSCKMFEFVGGLELGDGEAWRGWIIGGCDWDVMR